MKGQATPEVFFAEVSGATCCERWEEVVTSRDQFGPTLRRLREARGVSLEQIASVTKVPASLWAAMERNDLARWPTGIYARAYMRSYAELVGLDPGKVVDVFCRFFPHGDRRAEPVLRAAAEVVQHELRWEDNLRAAGTRERRAPRPDHPGETTAVGPWRTLGAVALELLILSTIPAIVHLLTGWNFWMLAALVVAVAYTARLLESGSSPLVGRVEREFPRLRAYLPLTGSPLSARK